MDSRSKDGSGLGLGSGADRGCPFRPVTSSSPHSPSGHPRGEGDAEVTELQGLGEPGSVHNATCLTHHGRGQVGRKSNAKRRQPIPLEL
jgi:hypothetical protein